MRIVLFYHSLLSDWNHGNAHFLRGVAWDLITRGHDVVVYEPRSAWSLSNLVAEAGQWPVREFRRAYPRLRSIRYGRNLDLDAALRGADLVIVHEWNEHELVAAIGRHHRRHRRYRLLFHDTHHRCVSQPDEMARYDLRHYDGVLAFGEIVRRIYLRRGWAKRAWTWHEAADVRIFKPMELPKLGDLVWIGNWGDEERTDELREFLLEPVRRLRLKARIYGVRYPREGLQELARCGIKYGGYLPNFLVPRVLAQYRLTVHVPRRPYVRALPGIPTIRPFEALACGVPLISAPWDDREGLFTRGKDYLVARSGRDMMNKLQRILDDDTLARKLGQHGRATILGGHTCAHRVDQLLEICQELGLSTRAQARLAVA